MADEYINRTAAIEELENKCHWERDKECGGDCDACDKAAIWRIPAADVAPVIHARWIREEPNGANGFRECLICSECHQPHFGINRNYCPHCGAKMDKEADE